MGWNFAPSLIAPHIAVSIFSLSVGDKLPSRPALTYGVPWGAILGLILFSLHMLPLGALNFSGLFHFYVDDTL